jgi:hypothetical protein
MNCEFEDELQKLFNKHGWDTKCGIPDFLLVYHVVCVLSTLSTIYKLNKQWKGEEDDRP